ncbi:23S rRNA (guanosine(2251)-2'-O)-methyltransferase RlmB [Peptoniphilus harei]|uniref:23S rRNA (guanosine(2251)-2'-O)-methyltransferase RlmB n=1 Tax=Peptoniphilus harei TaxID=54005 RepID=UPI0029025881|nr:23S rRNA (guanosine(2251)-2'-O)-methyltransferase RlmB [Peptoniphilus harei]MDU1643358.1 23S rRNA (guanosine(2251)-2'-O)-methyltransferase RlmB [Peptoniphilus harei]
MKYIYGRGPVMEAIKNEEVEKIYVGKNASGSIKKILGMARDARIPAVTSDNEKLEELAGTKNRQAVVALVSDFEYIELEDLIRKLEGKEDARIFILDKIEDPHNFGAIARSSNFFGVDAIIFPNRRAATVNDTVVKSSAGAIYDIDVCKVSNISQSIDKLKEAGFWIYATDLEGEDIRECDFSGKAAIVIGNEGKGVSKNILKNSDKIITIPNFSDFDSLNASVAAAIVMYEIRR